MKQPNHPYCGMWVTADGHIRHELLPDGRYDEARGRRQSAYQGKYWVKGDHIEYVDDTEHWLRRQVRRLRRKPAPEPRLRPGGSS